MANIRINFAKFDSLIKIADYFRTDAICKHAIAQERWGSEEEAVCDYITPMVPSVALLWYRRFARMDFSYHSVGTAGFNS